MDTRLDTLEKSEKAPEKETSNTQYNGRYTGGNSYNPKRYGRGMGYHNHRCHGDKKARTKTNQKQTTKRKVNVI